MKHQKPDFENYTFKKEVGITSYFLKTVIEMNNSSGIDVTVCGNLTDEYIKVRSRVRSRGKVDNK